MDQIGHWIPRWLAYLVGGTEQRAPFSPASRVPQQQAELLRASTPHIATSTMAAASPEAPVKKKFQLKKPLFNKPSWASPQPISTSEDIFSRSNKSYAVVAENEERRRKKKAKKAAKRAQEIVSDEDADEPKNKKRRTLVVDLNVSDDQDDDESSQSEAEEVKITELPTPQSRPSSKARITPETPTRSKQNHLISPVKRSEPPSSHAEVIDVNDSDNDKEPPRKPPEAGIFLIDSDDDDIRITSTKPKPLDVTNEEVSDEEFAELARQARENARRKRLNLDSPSQSSAGPSQSTLGTSTLLNGSFATTSETPQPLQDPVVSILITSHLPGTDMVIIKRRLNQRLRDVRIAWCNQQGYNDAEAALIVLTFRGRRVFDINTCKSLGIGVDEDGEVVLEGEKDVLGEANRRIHMEATTEVMYLEMQKQEEERHRGEQPEEPDEEEVSEVVQPKPQERQTRIILKAKGLQDFKLIVKDSTTISHIMSAFQSERHIGDDKDISLMFDGERLEPDMTVQQTDMDDMDHIDVYVR